MSFKCCFRLKADMTGFTDNPILAKADRAIALLNLVARRSPDSSDHIWACLLWSSDQAIARRFVRIPDFGGMDLTPAPCSDFNWPSHLG